MKKNKGSLVSRKHLYYKNDGKTTIVSAKPIGGGHPVSQQVLNIQAGRSSHARAIDESLKAPTVPYGNPSKWLKAPNRFDLPGLDTPQGAHLAVIAMEPHGKVQVTEQTPAEVAPSEALQKPKLTTEGKSYDQLDKEEKKQVKEFLAKEKLAGATGPEAIAKAKEHFGLTDTFGLYNAYSSSTSKVWDDLTAEEEKDATDYIVGLKKMATDKYDIAQKVKGKYGLTDTWNISSKASAIHLYPDMAGKTWGKLTPEQKAQVKKFIDTAKEGGKSYQNIKGLTVFHFSLGGTAGLNYAYSGPPVKTGGATQGLGKSKEYWITKPGNPVTQEKVKGWPVHLAENVDTFIHKTESHYYKFAVSEAKTGLQAAQGKTKADAIEQAKTKMLKWEKEHDRPFASMVQKALAEHPDYLTPPYKTTIEAGSSSGMSDTVEKIASGDQKKPDLKTPNPEDVTKHIESIEKGTKDWDADLQLVSGKKGTNEGGLYKDKKTQTLHYVKWGKENNSRVEALTARLYQLADVPVPSVNLITFGGKRAIKSDWIDNAKPMTISEMSKHQDVRNNFVVDAWLANWDVVGTNADNIVKNPSGTAYRIDLGGSLIFRAQGKEKPFKSDVPELESMADTSTAPQAGQVFNDLSWHEKKAGAAKVAAITDIQIDQAVDQVGIPHSAMPEAPSIADPNEYLKKTLKARRNHIIENVLKYEPPKPLTVEELSKLANLKEKNIELIRDRAPKLTPKGSTAVRQEVHNGVMRDQLGDVQGEKAIESLHHTYQPWKGSPSGTTSDLLRWAISERQGRGDAVKKILDAYWKHEAHGKETTYQELKAKFDKAVEKYGNDVMSAVTMDNEMHKVLIRAQMLSNIKGHGLKSAKKSDTVTVYRAWRPDQVKYFGWGNAKEGDVIQVTEPLVFCFTFDKNIADHFYAHGGKEIRAEVPIDAITLSDRLTNVWGSYTSEDEVLFMAPKGYQMEVVKA